MSAGYDPTKPGLDEARLYAYEALFIANLGLLNTAMRQDALAEFGEVTADMVQIGDNELGWDIKTGPVRIRIVAGGEQDGLDFQSALVMGLTGNTGWSYDISTNIYVYLHPDVFAGFDTVLQARYRELSRSRIADWVTFGVCNNWDPATDTGGALMQLKSNIFTPAPGNDPLLEAMIKRVYKGWVNKSFGGDVAFPCLHLVAHGTIM